MPRDISRCINQRFFYGSTNLKQNFCFLNLISRVLSVATMFGATFHGLTGTNVVWVSTLLLSLYILATDVGLVASQAISQNGIGWIRIISPSFMISPALFTSMFNYKLEFSIILEYCNNLNSYKGIKLSLKLQ